MNSPLVWGLAVVVAGAGLITDWRWRRLPNWLTLGGALAGIAANGWIHGWGGAQQSLLGLLLGLALLLPLVLLRGLGAGDWKLAGAMGAICGPSALITVLVITILVAGLMAVAAIVYRGRVRETLLNMKDILRSLLWLQMPAQRFTTDDPHALKIPFGVAMGVAVIFYAARQGWSGV